MTNDLPRAVLASDLPFPWSPANFPRLFHEECARVNYMARVRWPAGFICSICGVNETPLRISTRPRVLRCSTCHGYLSPSKALPRRGGLDAGRLRLRVITDTEPTTYDALYDRASALPPTLTMDQV